MARKNRTIHFENITVIDAGAKGKAIAKAPDGRVIFISNAIPGDIVDVQVFKKRKAFYEGKATYFHVLSNKRTNAVCDHFGICGGCKWQHMSYEHQLYYKQKEVTDHLERIGNLKLPKVLPIIGSEKVYFYRNKMEFSFSNSRWLTEEEIGTNKNIKHKQALGFHIPGKWDKILDINHCHLQEEPSNKIRNAIKQFAIQHKLEFFNPREQSGFLRTLMIRTSSINDIMVVIQFFKEDIKKRETLLDFVAKSFPDITSLQYIINKKANDTIYDQEVICYYGKDFILEKMEGLTFKINAKSFYQTNSNQAYMLYKIVRDFADLKGNEVVYDLYTGTGTIAQFIAKEAKKVIGIEAVPDAIKAAKENAQQNNITNISFYVGDMKYIFNDTFVSKNEKPDIIITDPPRDGMHKDVVKQILTIAPKKIIYISCNSATQARDLALMSNQYKIILVQPIDMFPQTHHTENVVLLENSNYK